MSSFFASKPAPTVDRCEHKFCVHQKFTVGAGLLAKASVASPDNYQDFGAFSYNGMTLGIAACKAEIRLADAG